MGNQTLVVIVGFVMIHVAFLLAIVSLATPVWIEATGNNNTGNGTTEMTKGLWEICDTVECRAINQSSQTGNK